MYSGTPTTIQHPCKRRIWRLTIATLPPAPADLLHQSVCGAVRRFLRHELNGCHSRRDRAAFGVGQAVLPLNRSYLPISSSAKTGRSSVRGTVMIGGLACSGLNGRMECGPSRIKGHRVWPLGPYRSTRRSSSSSSHSVSDITFASRSDHSPHFLRAWPWAETAAGAICAYGHGHGRADVPALLRRLLKSSLILSDGAQQQQQQLDIGTSSATLT